MAVDWGSVADWVSGVSTAGTLATGLVLIKNQRRDIVRDQASSLRTTLDIDDPLRASDFQPLRMVISSAGNHSFQNIVACRRAHVELEDGSSFLIDVEARAETISRFSRYSWNVLDSCRLTNGRAPHAISFTTYYFHGEHFCKWPGEIPVQLGIKQRRRLRAYKDKLESTPPDRYFELEDDSITYSRIGPEDLSSYW